MKTSLNQNNRRAGALERRKANAVAYTAKLKEAKATKADATVVDFYTDKLNKANTEVKILEKKVTK